MRREPAGASFSPFFAVVFDSRFPLARALLAEFDTASHRLLGFAGDPTAVWSRELAPAWARGVGDVAGVTTPRVLQCLEQLAAQHWLRVKMRNEHRLAGHPLLVSWVIGRRIT